MIKLKQFNNFHLNSSGFSANKKKIMLDEKYFFFFSTLKKMFNRIFEKIIKQIKPLIDLNIEILM